MGSEHKVCVSKLQISSSLHATTRLLNAAHGYAAPPLISARLYVPPFPPGSSSIRFHRGSLSRTNQTPT